jgi:hypothetical protein
MSIERARVDIDEELLITVLGSGQYGDKSAAVAAGLRMVVVCAAAERRLRANKARRAKAKRG